jgi:hypothetical protein
MPAPSGNADALAVRERMNIASGHVSMRKSSISHRGSSTQSSYWQQPAKVASRLSSVTFELSANVGCHSHIAALLRSLRSLLSPRPRPRLSTQHPPKALSSLERSRHFANAISLPIHGTVRMKNGRDSV